MVCVCVRCSVTATDNDVVSFGFLFVFARCLLLLICVYMGVHGSFVLLFILLYCCVACTPYSCSDQLEFFFFCTSLYSGLVFFTLYFLLWFGATTTDRRWCDCGSPKFMIAIYFQFLTFQFRCRNVRRFEIRIPHTHTTIELCLFIFNKIVALNIGNVFSTACTAWYSESGGKQRKRTNCIRLQNRLREEEQLIYFDSSSEYIRDIK